MIPLPLSLRNPILPEGAVIPLLERQWNDIPSASVQVCRLVRLGLGKGMHPLRKHEASCFCVGTQRSRNRPGGSFHPPPTYFVRSGARTRWAMKHAQKVVLLMLFACFKASGFMEHAQKVVLLLLFACFKESGFMKHAQNVVLLMLFACFKESGFMKHAQKVVY